MTAPTDLMPGDRVVCIGSYMHRGDFGVVVERCPIDSAETVPVQFDGEDGVYRALTPYDLRKLPPAWQPKEAMWFATVYASRGGFAANTKRFDTTEKATDDARKDALNSRGLAVRVCAVVPLAEVVAPPPIYPDVEVKEL